MHHLPFINDEILKCLIYHSNNVRKIKCPICIEQPNKIKRKTIQLIFNTSPTYLPNSNVIGCFVIVNVGYTHELTDTRNILFLH